MGDADEPRWDRLRSWNGSQHEAFEELCCQLARHERVPDGSRPWRLSGQGGDGGVEFYWQLPAGEKWGWQAKFFEDGRLDSGRWRQLDDSVRTALAVHPELSRYTVCLPFDLTGPRHTEGRSQQEQWEDRELRWQQLKAHPETRVRFELWGASEIVDRLSRREHAGRREFWFGEHVLGPDWFEERLQLARDAVRQRYTPDRNVDTPLLSYFDGIGRSTAFCERLQALYRALARAWRLAEAVLRHPEGDAIGGPAPEALLALMPGLLAELAGFCPDPSVAFACERLRQDCGMAADASGECCAALRGPLLQDAGASSPGSQNADALLRLYRTTREAAEFLCSTEALLAESPYLVLTGDAGAGKTHLLCHVADQRVAAGHPTVLVVGQHLDAGQTLWPQIMDELRLGHQAPDVFIGALEAAAQAAGTRALIMLDAINESANKEGWAAKLSQLRGELARRTDWIGLVISCRTSYYPRLAPQDGGFVTRSHDGFGSVSRSDLTPLFTSYGLDAPRVPLLDPELSNPLFVHVLCRTAAHDPATRGAFERGRLGEVFSQYLAAVDGAVCKRHSYGGRRNLVAEGVGLVARQLAESRATWLEPASAQRMVDELAPQREFTGSLYRAMCDEGVLLEDYHRTEGVPSRWAEGVRLTFDRLSDQLVAACLLDESLDPDHPDSAFLPGGELSWIAGDEAAAWSHAGLVEELCLQLPERTGHEFPDLGPWRDYEPVMRAFLRALPWRPASTVGSAAHDYLGYLLAGGDHLVEALDALVQLAPVAGHPLNCDGLDALLDGLPMPDRDVAWSRHYLGEALDNEGPLLRLLHWAETEDTSVCDDETARLCSTALAWCLTSPDRELRDRATKALVRMLGGRYGVAIGLLEHFAGVDDPYMSERLYAAAYGIALRGQDDAGLCHLARRVYEMVFSKGSPPSHLLLRDYARGTVELAQHRAIVLPDMDPTTVPPPYQSTWPLRAPSEERLRTSEPGYESVRWSVSDGDFGIYVIGRNGDQVSHFRFPLDRARRWVLARVIALGWTPERFGEADGQRMLSQLGRSPHRQERVGKKYQWIAAHELLARVADHCEFEDWGDETEYEGPWQLFRRDTDPSLVRADATRGARSAGPAWWAPVGMDLDASAGVPDLEWLGSLDDLPDPARLIDVQQQETGQCWLALQAHHTWEATPPPGYERYDTPMRVSWCQIRSYLADQGDADQLWSWLRDQHFMGRWMPESREYHQVYAGEYPWAPSCRGSNREWLTLGPRRVGAPTCKVVVTAEELSTSYEYDFSSPYQPRALVPSPFILRGMQLQWRPPFRFVGGDGELAALDPSAELCGPSAIVVDADRFRDFMSHRGLDAVWTVLGEKGIVGGPGGGFCGSLEFSGVYRLGPAGVVGERTHVECVLPVSRQAL